MSKEQKMFSDNSGKWIETLNKDLAEGWSVVAGIGGWQTLSVPFLLERDKPEPSLSEPSPETTSVPGAVFPIRKDVQYALYLPQPYLDYTTKVYMESQFHKTKYEPLRFDQWVDDLVARANRADTQETLPAGFTTEEEGLIYLPKAYRDYRQKMYDCGGSIWTVNEWASELDASWKAALERENSKQSSLKNCEVIFDAINHALRDAGVAPITLGFQKDYNPNDLAERVRQLADSNSNAITLLSEIDDVIPAVPGIRIERIRELVAKVQRTDTAEAELVSIREAFDKEIQSADMLNKSTLDAAVYAIDRFRSDFEQERKRADTAEAELKAEKDRHLNSYSSYSTGQNSLNYGQLQHYVKLLEEQNKEFRETSGWGKAHDVAREKESIEHELRQVQKEVSVQTNLKDDFKGEVDKYKDYLNEMDEFLTSYGFLNLMDDGDGTGHNLLPRVRALIETRTAWYKCAAEAEDKLQQVMQAAEKVPDLRGKRSYTTHWKDDVIYITLSMINLRAITNERDAAEAQLKAAEVQFDASKRCIDTLQEDCKSLLALNTKKDGELNEWDWVYVYCRDHSSCAGFGCDGCSNAQAVLQWVKQQYYITNDNTVPFRKGMLQGLNGALEVATQWGSLQAQRRIQELYNNLLPYVEESKGLEEKV